uniref:Predicted putative disease resistance protein RGA3 isoform X2 n=1 Tax=Malus domestica TaxID=3750 RepID=A0A4Y1QCH9_MALDO|nr:predicted putative disease resistance protein RGA3 isoform X2 [Malus domestica]
MALGEVFLGAFLQLLLDRLTPREILEYFGNFRGVGQKLEKWRTTLSTIGAVLSDAEERQLTEGGVKLWLHDLRDLAYDIEDMLDKFAIQMLKRMIEGRDQGSTSRKRPGECILPFPLLEILEFLDKQHWKVWLPFQLDHGSGCFPCLKRLSIKECSKLEAKVEFELLEYLCLSNISEVMSLETGELFRKGLSKVTYLKISGCEKLMSSFKNEARLLQQLTSLGRLEIEGNSRLVEELGEEAEELLQLQILECKLKFLELNKCENLVKLPKGLNQLSSLQELCIHECSSLVSFPDVGLPPSLKNIKIRKCDSLIYFAKFQIPQNLKIIDIGDCKSLKSLVDEEECERLGLIAPNGFFSDNTNHCLECIDMFGCQNLKSLPDGLCHLSNLQELDIRECGSLVSILRLSGGRRPSNLIQIHIENCEKFEALPEDMHNLNSLETLSIDYREGLIFPPNLTSLVIWKVKSPDTVSFPPNMVRMETLLPKSLTRLVINDFPNLKKLSSEGFQFLTSLQYLGLWNCPKLASIPEEGLPPSLEELWIYGCPVLKERCQPGKGRYWHKISHIPYIRIDDKEYSEDENEQKRYINGIAYFLSFHGHVFVWFFKNGFAAFINHRQSFDNVVILSAPIEEHGEVKFEAMVSSLPKEIVCDILLRLPPKALIRCTSVSKPWNSMIKNPSVVHTHLRHTIDFNQFGTHHLLLRDNPVEQNYYLHLDNHAFDEYCKLEYPSVSKRNRFPRVVYSLARGLWSSPRSFDPIWCSLNDGRYQNFILAIDVDDGNSIAMFTTTRGRNCPEDFLDIWVMKEYGIEDSWAKLITLKSTGSGKKGALQALMF